MFQQELIAKCALLTTLFALYGQQVLAEVDQSAPDLSMFKLRSVNQKEQARKRASQPITDLANGALHLSESLFVDDQQITCASYARLFDIIKGTAGANNKVRQTVVESLAVVVVWDKEFYTDLFAKDVANRIEQLGAHFLEAASKLESETNQKARDTWAQLVGCMSSFLAANNKQVVEYLSDSQRSEQINSVKKFNAISVVQNDEENAALQQRSRVRIPANGLVHHLAKKIDGEGPSGRRLFGRLISEETYNRSRKLVDSVEEERVLVARRQASEPANEQTAKVPAVNKADPMALNQLAEKPQKLAKFKKNDQPLEVDLVLADKGSEQVEADKYFSQFNENQLAVLEFVKMRLTSSPGEAGESATRAQRLSMELALDFQSHWEDLEQAHVDPTTAFGRRAITFLEDEQSQQVARRVDSAIGQYVKLISLLAEMKIQEDKFKSFDPLQKYLERLTELLNAMDSDFDVDNVRRMHAIWKAKYVEYRAMERFINSSAFNF